MPEQTTVKVTADLSQLKQEFAAGTAEFNRWAQHINAGNATAMKAFRATADELRQLGKDARVSSDEMDKLNATIRTAENAATAAGNRTADAFERGARGLSVMARQGDVTARSMNQIIAAGADIAFAFGATGTIISAVLMVTAGIVAHFENAGEKIQETQRKFEDSLMAMIEADNPVAAAKEAAKAYLDAQRAMADAQRDLALIIAFENDKLFDKQYSDMDRLRAIWLDFKKLWGSDPMEGAKDAGAAAARTRKVADQIEMVHGEDSELSELKGERQRLRTEIAGANDRLRGLRGDEHAEERRALARERDDAVARLASAEATTRRLLDARNAAVRGLNAMGPNLPEHDFEIDADTMFENERAQAGKGLGSKSDLEQARKRDADRKQLEEQRVRDMQRASALLIQIDDSAAQHEALSDDQREAADKARAQRAYDQRITEIQSLRVKEAMKTQLLVAAARERDAAVAAVERTAYDRQQSVLLKHMTEMLKENDKTIKAQEDAERKKQQLLTGILASSGEALVRGHGDLAHRMMQAAVAPIVKELEAQAMRHYALAAADALTGNYVGAAEQTAGATALMAGASLVGSIAGSGGGGGGGGGTGAGGGGMSSASHLGASGGGANNQPLQVHVIVVHQDANGREISRMRQEFQRLDDRNVSTRIGALG